MRRFVIVGAAAAGLLAPVPVQAGSLKSQAQAAAREAALVQAVDPAPRRSQVRTWSGIGMVGAGLVLAFSGNKECGTAGSLGPGWMQTVLFASVSVSATGLAPVMASGGECAIEFTVTSRLSILGEEVSESSKVRISRRSQLDSSLFPAVDIPPDVREDVVESILGTATSSESRSRGRMVAGIGMAGAGILLATVFANSPVEVTRLDRSGVAVGTRWSW